MIIFLLILILLNCASMLVFIRMLWGLIIALWVLFITMPESIKKITERSVVIFDVLKRTYSPVTTFLTHKNEFELLIAVILSAQATDVSVNKVTRQL